GSAVFDYETELEPVFSKFIQFQRTGERPTDDGRVPGLFGRLVSNGRRSNQLTNDDQSCVNNAGSLRPLPACPVKVAAFRIYLPPELKTSSEQTEQLLLNLASSASFVSFEIIGNKSEIIFQIACPETEKTALFSQLKSHLPTPEIRNEKDALSQNFQTNQTNETVLVDFGLAKEWFIPLPGGKSFAVDTLLPLIASFDEVAENETLCLQVLFCRTRGNWQGAAREAVFDRQGKPIFANLQNYLAGIKEKLSSPLLAVRVRLLAQSGSREKSLQTARRTGAFFRQFSAPSGNELIPLRNDELPPERHLRSFLNRTSYRSGMLLSARELSSIVHLPSDNIKSVKLKRDENNTKSAPEFAVQDNFFLGENIHSGTVREVSLNSARRIKHTHLIGASGSGKSTLLTQMMVQDLESGNGFACFDPHGDLIDSVMERISESRLKDVIIFDPSDEDYPIGFNILSAHSELEKTLLSSDLVSIFRRFSTSWGDVMNSILANAVLAFLESNRGGSLLDLKRFLIERAFREDFLKTGADEEIRYYWQTEFPQIKGKPFAPLLTRLDTFLRSKLIRHIVAQKENKLDFRRIMDERKILLVRLSLGAIGKENAYLLGSLLVSKLYHATLSRQNVAEENRPPFFLYLDEAHHFVAESMNQILSGVRKYKLGLVLAHQQLRQFQAGEADILASVLANCYTRICFRLDDADAERLAKGFSFFTAEHLKNLGVGEAICRFEQSRHDFNLKTLPLEKIPAEIAAQRKNAVIEQARKLYAKPKAEIEAETLGHQQIPMVIREDQPERITSNDSRRNAAEAVQEENRNQIQPVTDIYVQSNHGRGGRHHQELQAVIKRMAESYGFFVEMEKSVLDSAGFVDVSLEKGNLKIACEVSVTSTAEYEAHNILKCLSAGYDYAVVAVSNQKKISSLKSKVLTAVPFELQEKVKILSLAGLLNFLREMTFPAEKSQRKKEKPSGQRLSFAEACEFFGIGASTLYRWIREGRVPFYRPGREYQFDRDELVLIGRHDLSGKRKASVKLQPLKIEKRAPKTKKEQDARYRKLLKLE
ncbi:MAG TPA: excisionase family DNA-binding protein, partial [Pyrinomonadaceae bacterium]|nr:excisionase family DNA-binding protein [Pyrinomonadaceae bacterium]